MSRNIQLKHWIENSKESMQMAKDMQKLKHYHWCLFFCHLALERSLKALIISQDIELPYSHDLNKLALKAGLNPTTQQIEVLKEITTFNLEARYDTYKRAFYKKSTKEYTQKWLAISESLYKWIQKQIN